MQDTPPNPDPVAVTEARPSPVQRRGMLAAILTQSCGVIAQLSFKYGIILLYLRSLGIPATRILVYVAFPFLGYLLTVPVAYYADRWGKKRLATLGLAVSTAGMALLALSGSLPQASREAAAVLGILVFSVAQVPFSASWYALLSPVVPGNMRGRFFGRLRLSWQAVGVAFASVCALLLSEESPTSSYQWLLAALTVGQVLKLLNYMRIPELEQPKEVRHTLREALGTVLHVPHYLPFCSYVFLLMLFTAAAPVVFTLIGKEVLGFGDNTVVWLGNLAMVGAVCGYFVGGRAVDRHGTKPVFLICHFGYGVLMTLFAFRAIAPGALFVWTAVISVGFGAITAASSIAVTTEVFALLPQENKSLAGAVASSVHIGGGALSSILVAWILKLGLLRETWTFGDVTMTHYDSVLLGYAGMVMLLVVTLGQVPSVVRKHEWMPGSR